MAEPPAAPARAPSAPVIILVRPQLGENVGTAARDLPKPVLAPAHAAREGRAALAGGERVGVLFGPERTGLANDDLIYADAVVSIPVNPDFFSLNLAQAVLLVAYEWFQSAAAVPERRESVPAGRPATKGELDQLLEHLIAELDAVNFFRTADRRASMSRALQLIFARAELREPDVHLLRGVVKEIARGGRRP